jgi:Domain of unknown function (DUF4956)
MKLHYQNENMNLPASFYYRFALDLTAVIILIRGIYYPIYKKDEFYFPFFIFNLIIFLITFLLNQVEMSMGAAFGLFAVFSMLRYKTEEISMKDMTYLFMVIAFGLINSIMKAPVWEVAIINAILLIITYLLESKWLIKRESSALMVYDKLDLIIPEKRVDLISDLSLKTGLKVHRVEILKIDYSKASVQLKLFYYE